jgi:hypothetical protein
MMMRIPEVFTFIDISVLLLPLLLLLLLLQVALRSAYALLMPRTAASVSNSTGEQRMLCQPQLLLLLLHT